jgi:hypothetical protein
MILGIITIFHLNQFKEVIQKYLITVIYQHIMTLFLLNTIKVIYTLQFLQVIFITQTLTVHYKIQHQLINSI